MEEDILALIQNDRYFYIPEHNFFWENIEFVVRALDYDTDVLQYASDLIRSNKTVMKKAVMKNGSSIKYASPELKRDKELILLSLKTSVFAVDLITKEMKRDKAFYIEAMITNPYVYINSFPSVKEDKSIALEFFKFHGDYFYYASNKMKNDVDVVSVAKASSDAKAKAKVQNWLINPISKFYNKLKILYPKKKYKIRFYI